MFFCTCKARPLHFKEIVFCNQDLQSLKLIFKMIALNEWEMIECGPSFIGADLLFIKETIASEIYGTQYQSLLSKKAQRIAKILKYNIGKGEWQIVCIRGNHAHKFVCSRNYFCVFQKKDGLKIYVWVNKFKTEAQSLQLPQ